MGVKPYCSAGIHPAIRSTRAFSNSTIFPHLVQGDHSGRGADGRVVFLHIGHGLGKTGNGKQDPHS